MGRDQKSVVAMVGQERKTNKKNGSLGFRSIFMHADGKDLFLMVLGTIGAVGEGLATPLVLYISSRMMNNIGISSNMDGNTFIHNINKNAVAWLYLAGASFGVCFLEIITSVSSDSLVIQDVLSEKYAFYFLVVGAAIWASSWAEISCWIWSGERQSTTMRIKYLEAVLNQDIQFFDTEVRTSDIVFVINTDAIMVQDAISEKLGNFIHYMATFVSGFVVGFTAVWQLALVTLAVVPMIAVIGGIHTVTLAKLSGKSQEALSQAGNIVEQGRLQSILKLRNFVNCNFRVY
ncbi:ABC transporter B family member 1 isoform F [Glycine soja]|uniref:ABC transporter B family member 1 isoform E n=1 Tax=Glycine soja TaxID=3848 RepID=A0A445JU24_GLYSO|nr:ABC transporter B family member 1 isoform E [Glycine soja]RZC01971.1 ABC transporter B family member 1 isoform F [Glycine soja]